MRGLVPIVIVAIVVVILLATATAAGRIAPIGARVEVRRSPAVNSCSVCGARASFEVRP